MKLFEIKKKQCGNCKFWHDENIKEKINNVEVGYCRHRGIWLNDSSEMKPNSALLIGDRSFVVLSAKDFGCSGWTEKN